MMAAGAEGVVEAGRVDAGYRSAVGARARPAAWTCCLDGPVCNYFNQGALDLDQVSAVPGWQTMTCWSIVPSLVKAANGRKSGRQGRPRDPLGAAQSASVKRARASHNDPGLGATHPVPIGRAWHPCHLMGCCLGKARPPCAALAGGITREQTTCHPIPSHVRVR